MRSQRNMYDRALTVAGGRIVEVGIPDRYSGPGVRDAAPWEIEAAITPAHRRRSAISRSRSRARRWPRSLPSRTRTRCPCWSMRQRNCRRRRICGGSWPRAPTWSRSAAARRSAGRRRRASWRGARDLVASALMQMLDLDLFAGYLEPAGRIRAAAPVARPAAARHRPVLQGGEGGNRRPAGRAGAVRCGGRRPRGRRRGGVSCRRSLLRRMATSLQLAILDRPMPLLEVRAPDATALAARLAAHDPPILLLARPARGERAGDLAGGADRAAGRDRRRRAARGSYAKYTSPALRGRGRRAKRRG